MTKAASNKDIFLIKAVSLLLFSLNFASHRLFPPPHTIRVKDEDFLSVFTSLGPVSPHQNPYSSVQHINLREIQATNTSHSIITPEKITFLAPESI